MRDWFWPAAVLSFFLSPCACVAVATIAPPRVVEADPGTTLPAAELIATPPVRTLVGYTRRVLHLPDPRGHTLAVFSYTHSALANWLFLIDSR